MPNGLSSQIKKVDGSIAAFLTLHGKGDVRFWEIFKGITTPAEHNLVAHALAAAERDLTSARKSLEAAQQAAKQIRSV
jgi:hypothetical protein